MSTHEAPTTTFGAHGDGCAACGAVLAPDQRYCLACGARRTDARLAFMEVLRAQAAAGTHGPSRVSPAAAPAPRPRANAVMVAAVGCLLMAMGIGVLLGRAGHDQPRPATLAPQVIKIQTAAPAPAAPTAADPAAGDPGAAAAKAPGKASKSKAAKHPAQATNKSLQQLDKLSPDAYQKQSQKLPKELGTGGKAPPKDNKPAAGGGNFESIG